MLTSEFNYDLPAERIAQTPLEPRDNSRLLVLKRSTQQIEHRHFYEIGDYLKAGDVLVVNNSRVIPARLHGVKQSGGRVEILLLERLERGQWKALVRGKKLRPGVVIDLVDNTGPPTDLSARIVAALDGAQRIVAFSAAVSERLQELGQIPLPPYITSELADSERYQTIYAQPQGSAAAPTAGLHFTPDLLLQLRAKGVLIENVTLHVGLDTFQPVKAERVADHQIHSESIELSLLSAERINKAKLAGGRIVAVGTTSVRVLESAAWRAAGYHDSLRFVSQLDNPPACAWKPVVAYSGTTDLFIHPGYEFRAVDMLITNFHLPQSSLLMLVSAFAGQSTIQAAYQTAIAENYRFYSFGDAMLIV